MDILSRRRIDDVAGCWEWTGCRHKDGYGLLRLNGKTRKAHRVSAHLFMGLDLNSEVQVMHRCDNPSCFNPEHLFLGTQLDNMKDCYSKGRGWQNKVTRCPKDHPLSGNNLRVNKRGERICRECS